jgi:hypothetical protein
MPLLFPVLSRGFYEHGLSLAHAGKVGQRQNTEAQEFTMRIGYYVLNVIVAAVFIGVSGF